MFNFWNKCINFYISWYWDSQYEVFPPNTWRSNNVVVTSEQRHFNVITSKWCFDVITASILRDVPAGLLRGLETARLSWFYGLVTELSLLHLPSLDLTGDKSTLVQVMACCRHATGHCANQCWPKYMSPLGQNDLKSSYRSDISQAPRHQCHRDRTGSTVGGAMWGCSRCHVG